MAYSPLPAAAHDQAVLIGSTKANASTPAAKVGKDGSYVDLASFAKYEPGASVLLLQLQGYAGISADGVYGAETNKAFTYWYWHTTRPDGSSDLR